MLLKEITLRFFYVCDYPQKSHFQVNYQCDFWMQQITISIFFSHEKITDPNTNVVTVKFCNRCSVFVYKNKNKITTATTTNSKTAISTIVHENLENQHHLDMTDKVYVYHSLSNNFVSCFKKSSKYVHRNKITKFLSQSFLNLLNCMFSAVLIGSLADISTLCHTIWILNWVYMFRFC